MREIDDFNKKRERKGYIIGIILLVVFVFGIVTVGCSADDSNNSANEKEVTTDTTNEVPEVTGQEVAEEEEVATVEDDSEEISTDDDYSNDGYGRVGDTFNGTMLDLTVIDIGIQTTYLFSDEFHYMYVVAEIENTSSDEYLVSQDTSLYIDDYQYETEYRTQIDIDGVKGDPFGTSLNSGRKCKFVFYTEIPEDAYNAQKVEFDIMGALFLFKQNGEWLYEENATASNVSVDSSVYDSSESEGIGNEIIDSDPDRYIPEGVSGKIDIWEECFYADSGNLDVVPGEYLLVGGAANTVITVANDGKSIEIQYSNKYDGSFALTEAENGSPCYWVRTADDYYMITFYEGGLYLYSEAPDDENDWIEGFYDLLD